MSLFDRLLDDAAVFPPGSLPLAEAVAAHLKHRESEYAALLGPLVLPATDLIALAGITADLPDVCLDVAVTVPLAGVDAVATALEAVHAARLAAVEVALPPEADPAAVRALADAAWRPGVHVVVEVPRDQRRGAVIAALAEAGLGAKLRTGGTSAELYPDEQELAAAVHALVAAQVPFKATAGLHHALRNTDPVTGFEQHGFLNLLLAVDAAVRGADVAELARMLAERSPEYVVERVAGLAGSVGAPARTAFTSFGTCSIIEPVDELVALGLLTLPAGARA